MLDGFNQINLNRDCAPESRLEYLSSYVFGFVTYDDAIDKILAEKAVQVCCAISKRKTFEYIFDKKRYEWYLIMLNMKFFSEKIEWGTSIRGAWWSNEITISSCGFYNGEDQVTIDIKFNSQEFDVFVDAIVKFSELDESKFL